MRSRSPQLASTLLLLFIQCTPQEPRTSSHADTEPGPVPIRIPCDDLVSLTGYEYSINSAMLVPATGDIPEYCEIEGQILPEVAFELRLPTRWNQRFLMFGNGGFGGAIQANLEQPVGEFFAVAATNTGHIAPPEDEFAAAFGRDRQKLIDFAYRSVHVTAITAKEIIGRYYDVPLEYAYFSGCSTGGRQALISAQRFPNDFDGILAGSPMIDFIGTVISHVWIAKGLREAPEDLHLLADRVYSKCDSVDGLEDGIIGDPRKCDFDPSDDLPVCGTQASPPDCYTTMEIQALETVYEDVVGNGERLFSGFPVGSEVYLDREWGETSAWYGYRVGIESPYFVWGPETFLRYMAFERPDPEFDLFSFDFDEDPARMKNARLLLNATDPDLSGFRDHGGKLLMYFGWADPLLNPLMGTEYYDGVVQQMGPSTREFFRLFMVPGMFHCYNGVGVDNVDHVSWLPVLVDWVEHEDAPDRIIGTRTGYLRRPGSDPIGYTRPLCPYPRVARYKGEGRIGEASSFECVNPAGEEP